MSSQDKAAMVCLAEAHRRDGVVGFVQRTAEDLGVPMHMVKNALQKYRDGELSVTVEEVTRFSNEEWAIAKSEASYKASQVALQLFQDIEKARAEGDVRAVRDLSQAISNLSRTARELRDGAGGSTSRPQQTTVQIVIPPKEREETQEIKPEDVK